MVLKLSEPPKINKTNNAVQTEISMRSLSLLTSQDPNPVEIIPATTPSPVLLVCDHAGDRIPLKLLQHSLSPEDMARHIAVDINAELVARVIAAEMNSTLVIQRYSRLVVDVNRPESSSELIPKISDGTIIPFNQNISANERKARLVQIYFPYHNRIHELLNERRNCPSTLVAIHSFTPHLSSGDVRVWHVDLMSRTSTDLVHSLQNKIQTALPNLNIGISQVFQMHGKRDYTLPHHAESRNIPNVSIEIRNDMLASEEDINDWGKLLAACLLAALPDDIQVAVNQNTYVA